MAAGFERSEGTGMRRIGILCAFIVLSGSAVACGATVVPIGVSSPGRAGGDRPGSGEQRTAVRRSRAHRSFLFGERRVGRVVEVSRRGSAEAFRFANQWSGTASEISVYVDSRNRAHRLVAAIYSDQPAGPGSLLATGSLSSPRGGSWNVVRIRPVRITRGKVYWIGVRGAGGGLYFREVKGGVCGGRASRQVTSRSLPSRWRRPNRNSCPLSGFVSGRRAASVPITASPVAPAPGSGSTSPPTVSGGGKVGWSAAYYTGWQVGSLPLAAVRWRAISELIVFSYGPNSDGTLNTTDHGLTPALQSAAVAAAHQHGRLALISIGGAEFQTVWEGACSSAHRAGFVQNTITQLQKYGYDGVDLDIEHDWGGPSHPDYVACIQAMRNGLDQVSTAQGRRPLLTEPCDPSWQAYMCTEVKQDLDQINMMGYGSDCTVNSCSQVAQDISNMTSHGIPKDLLGIGIGLDPGMPAATAPHSPAVCASTAQYAITAGIGGIMEWTTEDDAANNAGQTPCFDSIAPYVAP